LYISRKEQTDATHFVYIGILNSIDYRRELRDLFVVQELQEEHYSVGAKFCLDLYAHLVHVIADKVSANHENDQITSLNVTEIPLEGLAKVRHVGGWVFRKESERRRKYVRDNMFSLDPTTKKSVEGAYEICNILEEHVVVGWGGGNFLFGEQSAC
jgi:hypothetical protein